MKDTMAVLFTYGSEKTLSDLTIKRSLSSVPFGGRYRVVDFMLSNLVNSGVTKVGVVTQSNYHSLMDHLGSGKEWDLSRKRDGLFILPPYVTGQTMTGPSYRGKLDALAASMTFIRRSNDKYVIMTDSDMICNMNFDEVMEFHQKKGADITVVYSKSKNNADSYSSNSYISVDDEGRVNDVIISPGIGGYENMVMEIYIIERKLLEYLVMEAMAHNEYSMKGDILQKRFRELKIYGWEFEGFMSKIESIRSYFNTNMELLREDVTDELFGRYGRIYTKVRDEVPTYYAPGARVSNCVVADGCIIEGDVEDCVISRGVHIGKGSKIRNSIILQNTAIMRDVEMSYAIADKDCVIRDGKVVMGTSTYPVLFRKGSVI